MRYFLAGVLATAVTIVTACAVGPDYKRPQFDAAVSYKEQDGWKPSEPGEAGSSGPWWRIAAKCNICGTWKVASTWIFLVAS